MRFIKTKKYGFTLIELIIVIAIIAILAAIAVPVFGQIRQKANVSADLGNARTIYSLVSTEIASDNIKLPSSATPYELDSVGAGTAIGSGKVNIESQIEPEPVVKAVQGAEFIVKLDGNGNIIVGYATVTTGNDNNTIGQFTPIYPKSE